MSAVIPSGKDVSTEEAAMQNLTTGFLLLPVMVAGIFLNALVVLLFWNWFVVPLGLKPLGYWHALGLSLFFSFIRGNTDKDREIHAMRRAGSAAARMDMPHSSSSGSADGLCILSWDMSAISTRNEFRVFDKAVVHLRGQKAGGRSKQRPYISCPRRRTLALS